MTKFKQLLQRPRYLRAIPSLVVLTTAMAWIDLPDTDAVDDLNHGASVSMTQRAEDQPVTPELKRLDG